MELTSDEKMRAIPALVEALFLHVLNDEDPIFVGDEATILDISLATPEDLLMRCSKYYMTSVALEDLRRPLWQLLPELEAKRSVSTGHTK